MSRADDTAGTASPSLASPRLTLVISSLRSGGAERMMSLLASHWAADRRAVTLLTFTAPDEPPFFPVDDRVRVVPLAIEASSDNVLVGLVANLRRARVVRRAIRASRPDAVISFMDSTNVLTLVATIGLPVPVIVSERSDPAKQPMNRPWGLLRRVAYRRAAAVVAQTESALAYFDPTIRRRGRVIPNAVVPPAGGRPAGPAQDAADASTTIVAMGRLSPEKGFDLLLEAFARLEPAGRGWTLRIWGDGAMRGELEATRARLGLDGVAELPGTTNEPGAALARARLFVLSSRHEGFPTVLGEAMALGLPVIAFDCPSGPREMIRDGIDGLLVPPGDVAALARAIERVLDDAALSASLGARATEIVERFRMDRIVALWDDVVRDSILERAA